MRRFAVPSSLLALLLVSASVCAAPMPKPEIIGIQGKVQGREARVKFTLNNGFTPELVEALKSGIEISFRTVVRVERVHRRWFDTSMGEVKFTRSVRYDALSRVYRLHRGKGEEMLPDIHAALSGMAQYEITLPLSMEAEAGGTYRAYVRTRLDKAGLSEPLRSILFFSSLWDVETEWAKGYLSEP